MAISYPLALPDVIRSLAKISIGMHNNVAMHRSPFTGQSQVYEHAGKWWRATLELPPMERADAEEWIGWLAALNGMVGTFLLGDPDGASPRGAVTGSPLVNGAAQTGQELDIDGLTHSITSIFLRGDWIQIGTGSTSRLYKVLTDADSNGSGETTLDIWPSLRESPGDNAAVVYSSAVGLFRLATNDIGYAYNPGAYTDPIVFDIMEAI